MHPGFRVPFSMRVIGRKMSKNVISHNFEKKTEKKLSWIRSQIWIIKPRLHQDTCCTATCVPDEQLVFRYIMLTDTCCRIYKLLVRDTCWLYLGDIITIHLCHSQLVSLCIQQQGGDKLATILLPIQETCWRQQWIQVDTTFIRQHVSWCKRGCKSLIRQFQSIIDCSLFLPL